MLITTIKTHKIKPGESIIEILDRYLPALSEKSIVAVTSKIISIAEKNLADKDKNKMTLIKKEADTVFPAPAKQKGFHLTLKNHRLMPNGGIDESNCRNFHVLLPKNPQLTTKKIWNHLRKKHQLKNLGVIITDSSTTTPLRRGVTGITVGWCGFKPIYSYIGQKDIFGSKMKVSQINLLDSLATSAILNMGEGNEQTPMATINHLPPTIKFQNRAPTKKEQKETYIDFKNDLFSSIMSL